MLKCNKAFSPNKKAIKTAFVTIKNKHKTHLYIRATLELQRTHKLKLKISNKIRQLSKIEEEAAVAKASTHTKMLHIQRYLVMFKH
jgi:hypothetical protein